MYLTGDFYNRLYKLVEQVNSKFIGLERKDDNLFVAIYKEDGTKHYSFYVRPYVKPSITQSTKQALKRFSQTHGYHFIYAVYDSNCEHCKRRVQGEIDTHVGNNKELF